MILLAMLAAAAAPNCANATTQTDMNLCETARAERAEASLNAQWKRLGGAKDPGLLAAQRLWIRFRDAECTAEAAAYKGGSMQPMVHAGCYADHAEERAKRLKSLADDAAR